MRVGTQFTGTVPANGSNRWFTFNWPQQWHVIWYVVPTTPNATAAEIEWDVQVQRASATNITYWINVKNLTGAPVNVEGRYAVLNQ
jgi:hypothetical protein